jgi:hypothetical protein
MGKNLPIFRSPCAPYRRSIRGLRVSPFLPSLRLENGQHPFLMLGRRVEEVKQKPPIGCDRFVKRIQSGDIAAALSFRVLHDEIEPVRIAKDAPESAKLLFPHLCLLFRRATDINERVRKRLQDLRLLAMLLRRVRAASSGCLSRRVRGGLARGAGRALDP